MLRAKGKVSPVNKSLIKINLKRHIKKINIILQKMKRFCVFNIHKQGKQD
jgi:hypothetical protein